MYVQVEFDTDYATFEEAMCLKYIEWCFNGNEPRMKKMTRDETVELIGRTTEAFNKSGASII